MGEPTFTAQEMMMRIHEVISSVFWTLTGEAMHLWLEISCAVLALFMFCWVVSRC